MADMDIHTFLHKFEGVPDKLEQNLKFAVLKGTQDAANHAKLHHRYKDRSSKLTNSVEPDGPHGSFRGGDLHGIVSAGAPYASYVEKGTKPHKIRPKHRKVLRFPAGGGGFAFARVVNHPGTEPDPFLKNAATKVADDLSERLVPQAVELSFVQCGFTE